MPPGLTQRSAHSSPHRSPHSPSKWRGSACRHLCLCPSRRAKSARPRSWRWRSSGTSTASRPVVCAGTSRLALPSSRCALLSLAREPSPGARPHPTQPPLVACCCPYRLHPMRPPPNLSAPSTPSAPSAPPAPPAPTAPLSPCSARWRRNTTIPLSSSMMALAGPIGFFSFALFGLSGQQ